MPKQATLPILYDEVPYLSTTILKEYGYLDKEYISNGVITTRGNIGFRRKEIRVAIGVSTISGNSFINMFYKDAGKEQCYKLSLVEKKSNLGRGSHWYFACPATGKNCRKLYFINGLFLHRDAFEGCMYSKQTLSEFGRCQRRVAEKVIFGAYEADKIIYKKYFKPYYKGKPTKKYARVLKEMDKMERLTEYLRQPSVTPYVFSDTNDKNINFPDLEFDMKPMDDLDWNIDLDWGGIDDTLRNTT